MVCHAIIETKWCCVMLSSRQGDAVPCCYRVRVVLCHAIIDAGWCSAML